MKFDVYFPFFSKQAGKLVPGVKPNPMEWANVISISMCKDVHTKIAEFRKGKDSTNEETVKKAKETKESLPCICYMGKSSSARANAYMKPTQLVMIDIDHVKEPLIAMKQIENLMGIEWMKKYLLIGHITPSGEGLRYVFLAQQEHGSTVEKQMDWFNNTFSVSQFGDLDKPCHDFSRVSFFFRYEDLFWENRDLLSRDNFDDVQVLDNPDYTDAPEGSDSKPASRPKNESADIPALTEDEIREFENYEYRGTLMKTIIDKWVEVQGAPGKGEIHNFYNEMVKNFRNICSNNKRALLYLLPRFGHSEYECWSSIKSITRVSTLSKLPRPFYFFLKDNGFYKPKTPASGSIADYMLSEDETTTNSELPWMPPVFREFIKIAPKDFRTSMVNALLPVMGTLTSYLQAPYYFDGRMHTTSFFSIIYAPAGTGKGFVERITDHLFSQLKIRDYVQQARENIFLSTLQRKGANEKSPEDPHTTLRIIPPKNSEAEFLQKMKDNNGYHMFTYAAEMDSWAKGVRAAGGNKDDMIRIAWDNGEYGQQFKSPNTFKGTVSLYWNLLITGTLQQLFAYFKNVENGLITRCSFTTIENQEFAQAPIWKVLSKKDNEVIKRFMERCDRNSYEEPCTLLPDDVDSVTADKFDEEIKWRFTYRKRQTKDMNWLMPTIVNFLDKQREKAAIDFDKARDVFRRRVAVRGFRLGLICCALWDNPRPSDLNKCIPFIQWWMEQDIEGSLKLWGARYNNEVEEGPHLAQRSLYNELPESFTKADVFNQCVKMGIKTPVRHIISRWKSIGYVKKLSSTDYEKVTPKRQ